MSSSCGLVLSLVLALSHWHGGRGHSKRARVDADSHGNAATAAAALTLPPLQPLPLPFDVRYCVAPMVAQSDLAFRMLTRRYGATVCYTPMLYASRFADPAYRAEAIDFDGTAEAASVSGSAAQSVPVDRPLIIQFAANDPQTLLSAALSIQHLADAVDLNLGCPQDRAKLGHYGSFLLGRRDWPLVISMVRTLREHITIPVMCKIRLLSSFEETLEFCLQLQAAGCACIAVHARKRGSNKRRRVGPADLSQVYRLRQHLSIPLIANGNIRTYEDAQANLLSTQCAGVMSADGILANPRIFSHDAQARDASCVDMAREYMQVCELYTPPPLHWVADHVHNMLRATIVTHRWPELRVRLKAVGRDCSFSDAETVRQRNADPEARAEGMQAIRAVIDEVETRLAAAAAAHTSGAQQPTPAAETEETSSNADDFSFDALLQGSDES